MRLYACANEYGHDVEVCKAAYLIVGYLMSEHRDESVKRGPPNRR